MRSRRTLPGLWHVDGDASPEESLRLREEQLRLSLQAAGQGLFDLHLTTGDVDVSPEYAAMIGHDPATFHETKRTWMDRLHPDDREAVRAAFDACVAGRVPHYEAEFRQRTRDGRWLWTLAIGSIVDWDAERRPLRMLGTHTNIDARKRAELQLASNTASLRALFEQAAVGMVSGDEHGNLLHANGYTCEMLGYTVEELRALGPAPLSHPDDLPEDQALFARLVAGELPFYRLEKRYLRKDGSLVWGDLTVTCHREHGQIVTVFAILKDITARKQAETALRQSEARLRAIVESEPECVKVLNAHCQLVDMNPAGLRMVAAPSIDAVRGCHMLDLVAPEYQARFRETVEAVFRGETTTQTFEIVTLDGQRKWMEQYAAPLWDPDHPDRVQQMLAVTRDITERRHAEASLRASEAQLSEAQRIAKLGSWEIDHATGQQRWSDEVFRIFGLEPGSVTPDQSVAKKAIHPDDRAFVEQAFVESMRDSRPFHLTHRLQLADGRVTHVEAQGYTHVGPDGRPLRTRATLQDVTERVIAEAAIRTSLREKEVLLREIHHRVKNNMQTVSSLLQFHAGKVEGAHAASVFADIHQRLRAMTLVHEKLYGSKDLSDVDFADYVESLVADVVRPDGRGSSISCTTATVPLRLPVGLALPAGMAIVELLTNVYKHAFDGRTHGQASVRVACDDGQVSVSVADDGVGMPSGFEAHATDSFGWCLVRSLAQQLNGTYVIGPGPGTHVTLSFPVAPAGA